jgi:hypothetical protein
MHRKRKGGVKSLDNRGEQLYMTFTFLRIEVAGPKPPLSKETERKAAFDYHFLRGTMNCIEENTC